MVKVISVSAAVCNMQGSPTLVLLAVGDDGCAYQLVGGKWEKLPSLESAIDQSKHVTVPALIRSN